MHRSLHRRARLAFAVAATSTGIACIQPPETNPEDRVGVGEDVPWVELRTATGFNWSEAVRQLPTEVDRIDRVLRNRAVFRREGFTFGHLVLGSGALYPYHAHASPEAYHVISGEAEWSIDGETRRIGPGTTAYHAPYADHRWVTTSEEPLRVVWAQWAPDGDDQGLRVDPVVGADASRAAFFAGERHSRGIAPADLFMPVRLPDADSLIARMERARAAAREREPVRGAVPRYYDAADMPWSEPSPGVYARTPFASVDVTIGQLRVEAGADREVPASGAPGLLLVLSGRARVRVGATRIDRPAPGTTIAVAAGEPIRLVVDREPFRALEVRYAPEGDMSYWARDYFLVEPMPEPPPHAALPSDVQFFE